MIAPSIWAAPELQSTLVASGRSPIACWSSPFLLCSGGLEPAERRDSDRITIFRMHIASAVHRRRRWARAQRGLRSRAFISYENGFAGIRGIRLARPIANSLPTLDVRGPQRRTRGLS